MYPTTFVAIVLGFWSLFHLSHSFLLKTPYFGHQLELFILNNNLSISYFHVRWVTSRWNRIFIKLSRIWSPRLKLWFNCGILFAGAAMVGGTLVLIFTLHTTINTIFFKPSAVVPDKPVLSVVVPGVNLPLQDVAYLLPSILISAILHEIGHAVAAVREGVQVNGFGIFAFLIYPGAFVDLNANDMNKKSALSKLRVYCAGVWHNFIICIIVSILLLGFPTIMYPFYHSSTSTVIVTHLIPNTPLSGTTGLQIGDTIAKIDSCQVSNTSQWYNCIEKVKISSQWGSCMPLSKIKAQMSHTAFTSKIAQGSDTKPYRDCCKAQAPATHLCYEYISNGESKHFACLPGRMMVSAHKDCMTKQDCLNKDGYVCAKAYTEPGLRFIRLVVHRSSAEAHNVLYIGDPTDILKAVTVSELIPRMSLFPVQMPRIIQRFLQYMFSMSAALALLNIVPCYALDGQWAFNAFLDGYTMFGDRVKQTTSNIVLSIGTLLLGLNVLFGFIHMLIR